MSYSETKKKRTAFRIQNLQVRIFRTKEEIGKKAAQDVLPIIHQLLEHRDEINIIFAAAPSQDELLKHLIVDKSIPWNRINAFHMDEYIGLKKDAPQGFGNYLKERIFGKVLFKSVHYINGAAPNITAECKRYEQLLLDYPVDIVCLGIGENGHIAFNDPSVANFNDTKLVKEVFLEQTCRQQQVNENCFISLDLVPQKAFTLTIPALMKAKYMFCSVPSKNKAQAVYNTLNGEISEKCPASILRTKEQTKLYLDMESASLIN